MDISKEDYLRVMYELYETEKAGIKSVDVADKLNVSKSSVSQMIRKLNKGGLVFSEPYSKLRFTDKGLNEARRIMHNHRVIETFLKNVLEYDLSKVHEEAHCLEHAFSEDSIKRLDKFLSHPKKSPYGRVIPH
ncbi:MAG: metal-dependent transcriptional regulator [Nanoarchaeota archaeon]|nr:metal-dependent transcriptional regulator [Nanoarchaeota archaeon]MBU1705097.1 metal-dependent transcriptional regulator [Nanoarchaeota archaeon]